MEINGRPDHIEDALCALQQGQWFTWSDSKNKIYANIQLVPKVWLEGKEVDNPIKKIPSEKEVTEKLAEIQKEFDDRINARENGIKKLKDLGLSEDELLSMGLK